MSDDFLEIPDFLRAYGIRKDVLLEAIDAAAQTGNVDLERKLRNILAPSRRGSEAPKIDQPEKKARLTRKLKEDTVLTIVHQIDDGHNTFARLRKASGIDDRILKAAIRHGLSNDVSGYRLTKLSGKVYGVHRRR